MTLVTFPSINTGIILVITLITVTLVLAAAHLDNTASAANDSSKTKLSGNITATFNLDNGSVLSVTKKPLEVICGPGSVWDKLFDCQP